MLFCFGTGLSVRAGSPGAITMFYGFWAAPARNRTGARRQVAIDAPPLHFGYRKEDAEQAMNTAGGVCERCNRGLK